jgi:ribonuclease E
MPLHATPGADQPDLPPVYSGPTPADPYGGQAFNIFDVLDQADEKALTPTEAVAGPHTEAEVGSPTEAAFAVPPATLTAAAEAAETGPTGAEPETAPPTASELATEPEPLIAIADAAVEPAIKPIIIGSEQDVALEKKRGWWQR